MDTTKISVAPVATPEELKALEAFPFVTLEERERHGDRLWLAIDTDRAYPWALEKIRKGEPPYLIPGQRQFHTHQELWKEMQLQKDHAEVPSELQEARAQLLDLARLYFTKAIHMALKQRPIGIHLLDQGNHWKY